MNKANEAAKVLSQLIYENGGCGPFGYERPEVRNNKLYLTSQTATEIYEVTEKGKVSLEMTDELLEGWQDDFGMDEEEVCDTVKACQDMDIFDLIHGKSDLSFFTYLENGVDKADKKLKEIFM